MLKLSIVLLSILTFNIYAKPVTPEVPGNPCTGGNCTEQMIEIWEGFNKNPYPVSSIPNMYSGDCYHLSDYLDPTITHYLGVLFEEDYMAPVFQYFGEGNDMQDWDLAKARQEMSEEWKKYGVMTKYPTSSTAQVWSEDTGITYMYWARQNPSTKDVYFLSYQRGWSFVFCKAKLN